MSKTVIFRNAEVTLEGKNIVAIRGQMNVCSEWDVSFGNPFLGVKRWTTEMVTPCSDEDVASILWGQVTMIMEKYSWVHMFDEEVEVDDDE
jgi:hypothetical protein